MKTILLARHGKAELFSKNDEDYDRLLTDVGVERTRLVAEKIMDTALIPELIMSSSASRAFNTALVFADCFGLKSKQLVSARELYECERELYLKIINDLDGQLNSVMFIGHNPTISELASYFTHGNEENFPTSAVLSLSFNTDSWEQCLRIPAKLNFYLHPGMF